ncbi:MAG: KR domain-containing protein, partial [Ilumatobacter fluminis]
MQNALHEAQTIVLLGGTSEIGRAIVEQLVTPATRTLVLACRRPDEANPDEFARDGLNVVTTYFDAAATDTHDPFVRGLAADHGDLDVVVVAFGQLGDQ